MHLIAYLELTLGRICQIRPVSLAVVCEVQCACHVMCAGKLAMWGPCGQAPCKRVQRQKYHLLLSIVSVWPGYRDAIVVTSSLLVHSHVNASMAVVGNDQE